MTYDSAADASVRRVRFYFVFDLWLLLNKVEAILHLHTVESSLLSGPLSHVLMANTHPVRTWDTMQHPSCVLVHPDFCHLFYCHRLFRKGGIFIRQPHQTAPASCFYFHIFMAYGGCTCLSYCFCLCVCEGAEGGLVGEI